MVAVSCSADSTVRVEQSMDVAGDAGSGTSSTPSTVPEPIGPPGTTQAPDPSGLPGLGDKDPATVDDVLDNGLRYLVRSNDNPGGKVELRLVINAGSGLEEDDQVGGAHFLEHMLFNGTERFPKNELVDVLRSFGAAFGADVNASTGYDQTTYTLNVPDDPEAVDTALDILEDWLSAATIAPDDVDAERGIVLDEWRSREQTSNGRIRDRLTSFMLEGTAYEGHLPIGSREAIESLTPEALRRFYDDWYRPDNAAVIVVGDIDVDRIVDGIESRFADAEPRGESPERVVLDVDPSTETQVDIGDDPDVAEGFAFVSYPLAAQEASLEADSQSATLESLAFDIVSTRLDSDALRGEAPYERAGRGSSSFVRQLSAPQINVDVDGAAVAESVATIVDEFERVARFGFTPAELERAIASRRSAAQRNFDGRMSRQDTSFADEYTRHVLEGEWYVPAEREFEFVNDVLDRATVETVAYVLVERYRSAGAHVFVTVPASEAGDVAPADVIIAAVDEAVDRELEPRPDEAAVADSLLEAPDPIDEERSFELATDSFSPALDPTVLEFGNGARVSLNTTQIVENQISFSAQRVGGLALVPDELVASGQALGTVIGDSGAGPFDRVALTSFLDDKSVSFRVDVDPLTDEMSGTAATDDIEVLFQLIHLLMTDPRADEAAVERYVDDELPFVTDPSIDAGYAEFDALLRARYTDPRFLFPTPESLDSVDVDGIVEVATARFGSANGWVFAFGGDFDPAVLTDLARRYIATIPQGVSADAALTEPPPPAGIVVAEAAGGQGETANVSFVFTEAASADRRDDVTALVVREIVGNRLTDFIREELGDSYSPFAQLDIGAGGSPDAELYISVSTAPELVDQVSDSVIGQLELLRTDGPSDRELTNAISTVAEQLNFINNAQINDEALAVLVDPAGNASFDEFVNQIGIIATVTADDVDAALNAWIDLDQYIEVRVLPRG